MVLRRRIAMSKIKIEKKIEHKITNSSFEERSTLRLSDTFYYDDEVDKNLARKLPVYRYHLPKNQYRWREWQESIHQSMAQQSYQQRTSQAPYPYLMRSFSGEFYLFIALEDEKSIPPTILDSENNPLIVEKVQLDSPFYPIWIRLLFRKSLADQSNYGNFHSLGRPLLLLHHWKNAAQPGMVQALAIDCRTQQLKVTSHQRITTEIALFYENIPLREVQWEARPLSEKRQQFLGHYWAIKDTQLIRTSGEISMDGPIYQEIPKNSRYRLTRPFINLENYETCRQSWPAILGPVQDHFIKMAAQYGFRLTPKKLNLIPLPTITKARAQSPTFETAPQAIDTDELSEKKRLAKNTKVASYFRSIPAIHTISVLDHRFCQEITTLEIIHFLQGLIQKLNIPTKIELISSIEQLCHKAQQPALILIDQRPKVVEDRYHLTDALRGIIPIQHINMNPYDISHPDAIFPPADSATTDTTPPTEYYQYRLKDLESKKETLIRNLDICLKELQIKSLLLDSKKRIAEILPEQSPILTENLILITRGYLFTVERDRPIFIPISNNEPQHQLLLDQYLQPFGYTFATLLAKIYEEWPYSYRPEALEPNFGPLETKLAARLRRLTLLLHKKEDGVTIMMQDPQYDRPHILFDDMDNVLDILQQREGISPQNWLIYENEIPKIESIITKIEKSKPKTAVLNMIPLLKQGLITFISLWNEECQQLIQKGIIHTRFEEIRKNTFKTFFQKLQMEEDMWRAKKRLPSGFSSLWNEVASQLFQIPLNDIRSQWLNKIPGISKLWYDPEQGYYVVGSLLPLQYKIDRQPSIRQWHKIEGDMDIVLLTKLLDVDWVRTNQLAGNPCPTLLIQRWQELQPKSEAWNKALLHPTSI